MDLENAKKQIVCNRRSQMRLFRYVIIEGFEMTYSESDR